MFHFLLLTGCVLTCTSNQAQSNQQRTPIGAPVKEGGVLDWYSGTWKRTGTTFINAPGAIVIYDNTCSWSGGAFYGTSNSCQWIQDNGRIPSRDENDPLYHELKDEGLADRYNFCGFSFSYCTGEQALDMDFGFAECSGGPCNKIVASNLTLNVQVTGLPASDGVQLACWNVTIDLSNTPNGGFIFQGNDDTEFDNDPFKDDFGWRWRPSHPLLNSANGTGIFIKGNPDTVNNIIGGHNTFNITPSVDPIDGSPCGHGLDSSDNFWLNTDGASIFAPCNDPSGCYFFGGYPGNPFGGWQMTMFGIPEDQDSCFSYCAAKASGSGCLASVVCDSGVPASGASDWTVSVNNVEGNRPGIFFTANTAQASIPFQGLGILCMFPPLRRGPIMFSFGTPNACDGGYSQLVNDGQIIPAGFDGGPGATTFIQAWYRDPVVTDTGTALSDAIEITWAP